MTNIRSVGAWVVALALLTGRSEITRGRSEGIDSRGCASPGGSGGKDRYQPHAEGARAGSGGDELRRHRLPKKEKLAKQMQKTCGTGGTVKEGRIEIQGDKREEVARILADAGFQPVFAGG